MTTLRAGRQTGKALRAGRYADPLREDGINRGIARAHKMLDSSKPQVSTHRIKMYVIVNKKTGKLWNGGCVPVRLTNKKGYSNWITWSPDVILAFNVRYIKEEAATSVIDLLKLRNAAVREIGITLSWGHTEDRW